MQLQEACTFLKELCGVAVTLLDTSDDYHTFCQTYRIHSVQDCLRPDALVSLFSNLKTDTVLCLTDAFHIRFLLCVPQNTPLIFGPYCTEIYSTNDCRSLIAQLNLPDMSPAGLALARGRFPVLTEKQALSQLYALLHQITPQVIYHTRSEQYAFTYESYASAPEDSPLSPAQLIEERYAFEAEFMENVSCGNTRAALKSWQSLHERTAHLHKQRGETLEMSRISAATTRATIRLAARKAGLSPWLLDQITSISRVAISQAETLDQIHKETIQLIRQTCRLIQEQQTSRYTPLVLDAVYFLEQNYREEILISHLAQELNVSTNQLIRQFKCEVHTTPLAYLTQIRMKKAGHLLLDTRQTIQEIAAYVGIPDSNYFAKLFKRAYQITPSEYRKLHT